MTKLLDQAFKRVGSLSPKPQGKAALILFRLAEDAQPVTQLTLEEEADLIEAQAEMERGEFATDAEVESVFSKYRL